MPDEPVSDAEIASVAEFRLALRRFERRTETLVRACGLTPQRYLLLIAVRATGTPTVSELAALLEMPQTTVTDLVARAADSGLLQKAVAEHDRRVVQSALTPEGERRLGCAVRALAADREALREALDHASQLHPA